MSASHSLPRSSLGQGQWKSCARDILCLLQDEALLNGSEDELQVVFHVFSNGGFLPYVQLVRLVETEEVRPVPTDQCCNRHCG